MNHSFETYLTNSYKLSEIKAVADRIVANNKDEINGYYIAKQEILESNI